MNTNQEHSDYQEVRAVPSVSRDRWLDHARKKLEKGYALIVSDQRRNANFYLAGRGYETCPHKTAVQLINQGVVKKAGRHHLGTMYFLTEGAKTVVPVPTSRVQEPDEEEAVETAGASEYDEIIEELEESDNEEAYDEEEEGEE